MGETDKKQINTRVHDMAYQRVTSTSEESRAGGPAVLGGDRRLAAVNSIARNGGLPEGTSELRLQGCEGGSHTDPGGRTAR